MCSFVCYVLFYPGIWRWVLFVKIIIVKIIIIIKYLSSNSNQSISVSDVIAGDLFELLRSEELFNELH
jgi:hypothetical protein